ncbi:MAG: tetratricopeptide repeat protein [Nocardiopsaceae bacterium]|nr:tetratricopeptide repeat protein [Nocardiopsaceae bacterium]
MPARRLSLQDLIQGRQQSGFVGRQGQVDQYRDNLRLPVDDERRRFLFNVHGDAGVGKTYLTKQLRQIADSSGALTAYVDDNAHDVISTMNAIAGEFSRGGAALTEFEKKADKYRAKRQELESDPHAPDGVASFLTKAAVTIGMQAARDIPFAGSLLAPLDTNTLAEQADRARSYIAKKFDHADVRLLLSPEDELSPVFVEDLNRVAAGRQIALFFDTYERTVLFLDGWMRNLYAGLYGGLPATLVTTISGQNPLNPNLWGEYLPVITDVPLEPFSDAEARQFLGSKNVSDEHVVQVILTLSGRLPMWLATLADARPSDPADIGDPAGDAVERFLKWEADPVRRAVAVTAALPRALNQDVLATISSPDQAGGLFGWLCGLPFVSRQGASWRYHEVVRSAMLRLKRAQSPNEWREYHSALAKANEQWATEAVGDTKKTWSNPDWVDYTCEEVYHRLCADPAGALKQALGLAVKAAEHSVVRARQWAALLAEAGRDSANGELQNWGNRLQDGIMDQDLTEYLSCLIDDASLSTAYRVIALEERGYSYRSDNRYEDALSDFNRAIELDPERTWAIAQRGELYRIRGRYEEALKDFDRAIELDPDYYWAIASRGQAHQAAGRYDEALTDFDRAIELYPNFQWAIGMRGRTYEAMGRYGEALADFNRAIELDPDSEWPVDDREDLYQVMNSYADELNALDLAIAASPVNASHILNRGAIRIIRGNVDEGVTDLRRAVELDASLTDDLARKFIPAAADYLRNSRPEMAVALFEAAVAAVPDDAGSHNNLGFCLLPLDIPAALAELRKARDLDYKNPMNLPNRVLALHLLGRDAESAALATSEEARNISTVHALAWIIREDHTLLLSSWIPINEYFEALRIHIQNHAGETGETAV